MPGIKMRSEWEFGLASQMRKGLLKGMGYTDREINRPLVAIVNSWNEYNPGHVHLKAVAERVKQGVRESGGLPLEVQTTAICDGMVLKDPKYIELPSRNLIADQVELNVEGNLFDAMVLISTCDSIVPGHLMGAARLNIPTIVVTGGYMPMGKYRGKNLLFMDTLDSIAKVSQKTIDIQEFDEMLSCSFAKCGACGIVGTANSMCIVSEVLGLSLPGNSTASALSSKLKFLAYSAGCKIMDLLEKGITARDMITKRSIKNAIKVSMAIGASTNLLLHIPAIAMEAGLEKDWWKEFDKASSEIPLLTNISPNGKYHFKDFDLAGGLSALLKNLLPKLDGDCPTVTGKTLYANIKDSKVYDHDVIRSLKNPVNTEAGIAVLYGNLAKEGGIIKISAVPKNLYKFQGPARVFNSLEDSLISLRQGEIRKGDAIIIRYLGPKARFGTTAYPFQEELRGREELFNSCAIITDGRYSGASSGLSIGYISPEAALGGILAIIKDGDIVNIDLKNRKINIALTTEEIGNRLKKWKWEFPKGDHLRYLNLFVKNISSAAKGAIWE